MIFCFHTASIFLNNYGFYLDKKMKNKSFWSGFAKNV